ncbi:N-acetyltransferase [Pseudomonas sp. NFIX28]|uniref:GNAT family N-acetyltransferase n=1 Tax=Pseudomonas sp. NFIX28 TaxID=1566235 RepID=UPI000B838585|nr:GNAT family N-acetyltransferase [Pseudomonas sp. NFIX28]
MEFQIRLAVQSDMELLLRLDPLAQVESSRRAQIEHAVLKKECWLASGYGGPRVSLGYGCLEKSFFGEWFIPLVVVSAAHRRMGVATRIISHLEHCASAEKIFTSTNSSNLPMQRLLERSGYNPSGVIENLDPGDPELVFVKTFKR